MTVAEPSLVYRARAKALRETAREIPDLQKKRELEALAQKHDRCAANLERGWPADE